MRLGTISDLHLNRPENRADFLMLMKPLARQSGLDVLLLGGDLTPEARETAAFVRRAEEVLEIPVYYVPGNHDIWNRDNGLETQEIYAIFREDPRCLCGQTVWLRRDLALAGDIFWYDYSYADRERYSLKDFRRKSLKGGRWLDKVFVDWGVPDEIQCERFIGDMERRIAEIQSRDGARFILLSHMICHPRFSVPDRRFEIWAYFNAFLGSRSLYELIRTTRPLAAIGGHVHHRGDFTEDGIRFISACLGYPKEWRYHGDGSRNLTRQLHETLTLIDLD